MPSQTLTPHERAAKRDAVARILATYPAIDDLERETVIHFIKSEASALDIALLAGDDATRDPLARFRHDHAARLDSGIPAWLVVAVLIAIIAGFCALAWDIAA
jgi:hypothetical protein